MITDLIIYGSGVITGIVGVLIYAHYWKSDNVNYSHRDLELSDTWRD